MLLKKLKESILSYKVEIFAVLVAFAVVVQLENNERARIVAEERDRVADQVHILQEQLSSTIIADMHLVEGLRIQLTQNPDWTQQEYAAFVVRLITDHDHPHIRNVAVAKDYVITNIAPLAGNEKALGLDYRTMPEQLAAVEEVISQGHTVITNPLPLVVGGVAIIGRVPFFIRQEGPKKIWGLISIVWDLDQLFGPLAEFNESSPYLVAARSVFEESAEPPMLFGEPRLFDQNPVRLVLQLEGNAWEIAAVPKAGWPSLSLSIWMIRLVGLLTISLLVTLAIGRKRKQAVICALERTKTELTRSEERYERAVAGTNDGLWDRNIQTGKDYYSPRWAEILGFRVDELRHDEDAFNDLIHPDDKDRVLSAALAHLDHKIPYDIEFRMRRKSGGYTWVQSRGKAVWDEDGQPLYMAGSITDITDRRKAEAALRESEQRFRKAFDSIETGTMVINSNGIIEIFNPAAEEIFGYKSDEVLGKNVSMLMSEPDRFQHDGYIQNYVNTGKAKVICIGRKVVGLGKNGEEFPMQLEIGEMKINNDTCFVASFADLTELQSLESQLRQSQKLEAVGQLTGGIAHDFNNLLAVIQGNLSLLSEDLAAGNDAVADEPMELIKPALEASRRGAELTQRLLAFSRKQALQPRILSLNTLVTGMENIFRPTLGAMIDLSVNLKEGDWLVLIDQSQLENALLNLVLNAGDAMADGGCLTIETEDVQLDDAYVATHPGVNVGEYIMLAVSDTGTGMTPTIMDKVFDPFFTTKGVGKGSGLGLSMVHGFVKQSGGHVEIRSELGVGTTVELYLPRTTIAKTEALEDDLRAFSVGGHETILVVEDDEDVRRMTVRIMSRLGYNVLEAGDGRAAINILEDNIRIDLLLTDVVLPGGVNGPQIAKVARKIDPGIKVFFMSAYNENAIFHNGRVDDGAHLIRKPFSPNDLAEKVREVLDTVV